MSSIPKPLNKRDLKDLMDKLFFFYPTADFPQLKVLTHNILKLITKYFNFDYKRCIWPNMADIWLAKFANEQNIPIILMEHTGSDFKYQESTDNIYKTYSKDDEIQTQLYNNI